MIKVQTLLVATLLLAIGACERAAAPEAEALPAPEESAGTATAEAEAPTVKVEQTQNGDRACYIVLEGGDTLPADFAICEIDLAGKTIRYQTEETAIQSMDCEGNPDCNLSDIVDLVVSVEIVAPE
jgi:hypothetical protein